jgi:predicted molibdopterin-dependent oxidoreductase YjgC
MHPLDAGALGLLDDMPIEIESRHGRTRARVRLADDIRRGVISLAHGFEDANPAALIDDASGFDALSGLPRMSAIPVRILRAAS